MKLDVLCFGAAGFDIYINGKGLKPKIASGGSSVMLENDTVYPVDHAIYEAGGSGLNSAIVFARQDIKTGLVARTGKDHLANQIKIIAKHEGIDPELLISKPEHHTDMNIRMVTGRTHEVDLAYHNSSDSLKAKDIKFPGLSAKMIYLAGLPKDFKIYKFLVNWAEANGAVLVVNISNLNSYHKKQIEYVISTANKLLMPIRIGQELFGHSEKAEGVMRKLYDMRAKSILLYDVVGTSYVYEAGKIFEAKTYKKVNPLDMTGAEDVFAAGYAAANFNNKDIAQSLTMASAMACSVMNVFGVRTAVLIKPSLRTMSVKSEVLN